MASTNKAPELSRRETLRWMWRQLTSMRTALLLLLLLAIAAVPGSIMPQRGVDARAVELYFLDNPSLAPWLDRFGFFNVYTSPWFSAIYILLMVSLIGCILPRAGVYFGALRTRPPRAPKNLLRLPGAVRLETEADLDEVMTAGRQVLGRARIDVVASEDIVELRSEKGYLREAGNLIFHISIVAVLVGVAVGALFGYRGAAMVVEGSGFSNVLTQYDEFSSGALFNPDDLPPFSITVDRVTAKFQLDGPQRGAPRFFEAKGDITAEPDNPVTDRPYSIRVNHPVKIGSTSVFLVGQGYAPVIKVTDAEGNVAFEDAVPFLPSDATYTSTGVVKVPDALPEQLGFQGFFLPTAVSVGDDDTPISAFPAAANPYVGLFVYKGDLGLDDGIPQSVYSLSKTNLTQVTDKDGAPFRVSLQPGQETDLPGGGTIAFVDLRQFARLQIASTPLAQLPLIGITVGIFGLIASLLVRPRRTWIRARRAGGRTVVEVAALDRVPRDELPTDLDDLIERLCDALGEPIPGNGEEQA